MVDADIYLRKAKESLDGAESELRAGRLNNSANRSYYACFQAAIAALMLASRQPPASGRWSHAYVQSEFSGYLVGRLKRYPSDLRDTLSRNMELRHFADYDTQSVPHISAARAYRRAKTFLEAVQSERERYR